MEKVVKGESRCYYSYRFKFDEDWLEVFRNEYQADEEALTIYGLEAIKELRDFLNDVLESQEEEE